ncbi:hypothetical protein H5410_028524 [Solanum commersonii]|uniref:Uncharacterized protein n=1 Tax=Solanum commersonii TaxID=4109 RepID=A0A9J5Z520_SOLCO|nr:hypothetical protein H5410_028524 [Solanum commersonii]
MAPKAKSVAGSKRSRKGEASRSSNARKSVQKFGKKLTETKYKTVSVREEDVKFSVRILNELLGTQNCDPDEFNNLKDKPSYRDIRHTLRRLIRLQGGSGALDTSHGPVLSAPERQACDDSVMTRMFGMAKLQLRIGGRPVTDAEMETMAERYPLTESAAFLCRTGPAFLEPLDNDNATIDEAMDDEDDNVVDEKANAVMYELQDHD